MKTMILITATLLISKVSFADPTKGSCKDGQSWKELNFKVVPNTTPQTGIRAQKELEAYNLAKSRLVDFPITNTPAAPNVLECSDSRIAEVDGNFEMVFDYSMSGPQNFVYRLYHCGNTIWVYTQSHWAWADENGLGGSGVIGDVGSVSEAFVSVHCKYLGTYEY